MFLELKSKKYKRAVYEKSFILSIELYYGTNITRMRWGGETAHSIKEVCENSEKQYKNFEANVYYRLIEFPLWPSENPPKRNHVKFFDANGDEQYYILQNPSDLMGYRIKDVKKEGEIFKLKGENPRCYGKSVNIDPIREE